VKEIFMLKDAIDIWQRRRHSFGDYSVTTLLNPPQVVQLTKRYGERVERPIESVMSAFMGSGVHMMFEENLRLKQVMEPRYDIERTIMDKIEDRIITGRFDVLWDGKHLYDFKTCKTWKKIFDPNLTEWHEQLNVYAHLLRNRGLDISSVNVIAIYMDWVRSRALRDRDYPQTPVVEYKLNLWDDAVSARFLRSRIVLMKENEDVRDENLPNCTDEERWMRHADSMLPYVFAVMSKPGATRALKICNTEAEAQEVASQSKSCTKGLSFIEKRYATAKRCEEYCAINSYCFQYKQYIALRNNHNLTERIEMI
jgi:hypothetical protein